MHEGSGDNVDPLGGAEVDQVVLVIVLDHVEVHLHPREVAMIPLAELAVVHDLRDDVVSGRS